MNFSPELMLTRLMENEIAVSNLYSQFGDMYPENREFWKDLSQAELRHAHWIDTLRASVNEKKIMVKGTLPSVHAIETSIKNINVLCEKCKKGKISRQKAYIIAHELEDSMLEKKFFNVLQLDSPLLVKLKNKLSSETEKHKQILGDAILTLNLYDPE